jgi:predicted DCC family thiol-disulfide oxidoreductase YuxK
VVAVSLKNDGECPLCAREVNLLRRLDRRRRIRFTDISAAEFTPSDYGRTLEAFMASIQGRLPSGDWIEGVEVFRRLYGAVGFGPLVALSRLPGLSWGLDRAYEVFARNRLRFTGRCSEAGCEIPSPRSAQARA